MHVECDIIDYNCFGSAHTDTKPGYILFNFAQKSMCKLYPVCLFRHPFGGQLQKVNREGGGQEAGAAKINFQPQILDKSAALALAAVLSR